MTHNSYRLNSLRIQRYILDKVTAPQELVIKHTCTSSLSVSLNRLSRRCPEGSLRRTVMEEGSLLSGSGGSRLTRIARSISNSWAKRNWFTLEWHACVHTNWHYGLTTYFSTSTHQNRFGIVYCEIKKEIISTYCMHTLPTTNIIIS